VKKYHISLLATCVVLAELGVALYAAYFVGLMSVWAEDDHVAMSRTNVDWALESVRRLAIGLFVALLFLAVVSIVHRRIVIPRQSTLGRVLILLPWALSGIISAVAAVGTLWFFVERPFV
jgi:hypothetical protein